MNPEASSTSHDGRGRTPRLIWLLGFLLLGHAVWITTDGRAHAGAELYGAWATAQVRAAATAPVPSPYADADAYANPMNARADALWRELGASDQALSALARGARERDVVADLLQHLAPRFDARQQEIARTAQGWLRANAQHRRIEVAASPLWCAACALLPADWDRATALYAALQCAALLLGAALLWRAAGGAIGRGVLLAIVLMVAYPSYAHDVSAGGTGCLALLLAAVPVALARRASGPRACIAVLLALVVLVLLEPRAATLALALAAHAVMCRGEARALRIGWPAAALALALLAWPCVWFGSANVWLDWLTASVRRASPSDWIAPGVVAASCALALRAAQGSWRHLLADPAAAAALGAVAAAGAGPAVPRSALLAVAALPWLLQKSRGTVLALIALAVALYAELAQAMLPLLQLDDAPAVPPAFLVTLGAIAWVPLWLAVLWQLARTERARVSVT